MIFKNDKESTNIKGFDLFSTQVEDEASAALVVVFRCCPDQLVCNHEISLNVEECGSTSPAPGYSAKNSPTTPT